MNNIFTTADCFAICIVSFIALATRLWLIADPDLVTFDEVHFGNFTNWYIRKEFFFDIHPPLGKMIMATIASWTQYKGDIDYGSKFGLSYLHDELFFVSQRITPAIFSAMTSPFIFAACRCISLSTLSSFCAALILTTDISLIVEGKYILSDGILHFFTALHIFCLCLFLADDFDFSATSLKSLAKPDPKSKLKSRSVLFHAIIDGITLGCASACKYTALGLYAVDGMTQIFWIFIKKPKILKIISRAFTILFFSFLRLAISWIWHFISLPFHGHGHEYINKAYGSTIFPLNTVSYAYWGDRLIGSSLTERILNWNIVMNDINMKSSIPHPFESHPINWPLLMDRWVGFFSVESETRNVQCMGTPFVYWFVFIGICITVLIGALIIPLSISSIVSFCQSFLSYIVSLFDTSPTSNYSYSNLNAIQKPENRYIVDWRNALLVWGWVVSYFPFVLIPRTMFLYHYLIPLMFGIMNLVAIIENLFRFNRVLQSAIVVSVSILCVLCFLFFSPWAYGTKCPDCRDTRMWTDRWILGPPMPIHNYGADLFNTTEKYVKLPSLF